MYLGERERAIGYNRNHYNRGNLADTTEFASSAYADFDKQVFCHSRFNQ